MRPTTFHDRISGVIDSALWFPHLVTVFKCICAVIEYALSSHVCFGCMSVVVVDCTICSNVRCDRLCVVVECQSSL